MNVPAARDYAQRHALQALLIVRDGETVLEHYATGYDAATPHALYSGTKSFWGPAAVAAMDDGLLDLDETVAATFPAWAADARKSRVTLRELLQLTSGIGFGGLGAAVPLYAKALAVELKHDPGSTFTYGGIPLQVFGAVFARKLAPSGRTPHDYLRERIFEPLQLTAGSWRTLRDGTHPLPTGAFLTARNWLKFGELIAGYGTCAGRRILNPSSLAACFAGSSANPRYGLGWWLSPLASVPDLAYASGARGQALYVLPSKRTVVVKFSDAASYNHETFLKRLAG